MRKFHENAETKFQPRNCLVGGLKATSQTLTSPLLKYLIKLGVVVTNIQTFVQYKRHRPFENVEKFITEKRIECAADPDTVVLEGFIKLIG